ncbi:fumarylacetoacetate hydrolase family protein [Pararhizobium haloflavum]|uniref:fumarylacetoacetate hydrolase family protein n=1 Tax=Pararhizobium haloflavum TaxID=2037914 RepID=UPI000C1A45B9|nr:fumarylacetoacetate hydrolase family protein [Pararhizobium haloflavum]
MQLISFEADAAVRIGAIRDDDVVDLGAALLSAGSGAPPHAESVFSDMAAFLAWSDGDFRVLEPAVAAASGSAVRPLADVRILAPISRPGKIIGVGRNYGAHAAEGGLGRQEEPRLFVKMATSVIGPEEAIICPKGIVKLDWEVELAAVVGRTMKNVAPGDALAYVAGYTLLNDISAREYQFDVAPPQTTFAKSMDTFTPMGPWLATADTFDGAGDHDLRCYVNDVLMQDGNTHDMIFSTAYILSYISRFVTLEPGDVIATGTPSGVGHFRDPPVYLKAGDTVRLESPGLGALTNPVAASR